MSSRLSYLLIEAEAAAGQVFERHVLSFDPAGRCQRARHLEEFAAAIQHDGWDVVLYCDDVPGLDIQTTLEMVQGRWPDLPLILIGGRIGEEKVAELLKLGVADFVLKDHPARLQAAVERSRWDAAVRRSRRVADAALVQSEDKYRNLFESSRDATLTSEMTTGKFTSANPAALKMFGAATEREFLGLTPVDLSPECQPDGRSSKEAARAMVEIVLREGSHFFEWTHQRLEGGEFCSDVLLTRIQLDGQPIILGTIRDISERKRTEELLRENEQQFRAMFETMTIGMGQADPRTGRFLRVNRKMCAITGYSEEEMRGMTVPEITHPEDRGKDWDAFQKVVCGEAPSYHIEKRYVRKDGTIAWVNVNMTVIRDAAGQPVRTLGVIEDITERRAAAEKILQEQARFKLIFDSVPIGIAYAIVQPDGSYQRISNDAHLKICGLTREEDQTPDIYRRITQPEDYALQQELADRLGPDRVGTYAMEKRYLRSDGKTVWVAFSYSRQRRTDGSFEDLTAVVDITERKTAEQALRDNRTKLEAALASMTDAVFISDATGEFMDFNDAFVSFHKFKSREETRRRLADYPEILEVSNSRGEVVPLERWAVPRALGGETATNAEFTLRRRDTGETWVGSFSFSPIRDKEGAIVGAVVVGRDITKRRELEGQVRQAQKMEAIGTLAGGIAHDFNNILCSIFGYGYLLQREKAGNAVAEEYLAEILKAANRAKELVQQILTFSRQREQKREVITLGPVIKEAMKFLRASLPANIQIETNLSDSAPAVFADPTQIYQITMNLATNSLHAMESRGGRLAVSLAGFEPDEAFVRAHPELRPIRYTRLTIADTGLGMDDKVLERIFEPFFTTKPVGKGTGLGLSVVHGIVQAHEAVITVSSTPGQGTVFELYFPAQAAEAPAMETPARVIPQGKGGNILFLDDELALTRSLQRLLEGLNYQVTLSNRPSEAIRLVGENPEKFNLIITDLTMPEMNGLQVARRVHELRPDLPVMLISGHAPDLSREKLREAGISGMLEKPFTLTALADMVKNLVQ